MSSPKVGTPAWDKFQKLAAFCATKGIKIDPNNVQMNIGGAYINQGGNVLGGSDSASSLSAHLHAEPEITTLTKLFIVLMCVVSIWSGRTTLDGVGHGGLSLFAGK